MALRDHLARFEGNPVLPGDSSDSGSAWSGPSCATEELGELPVYEFVSVPEEKSFYHPPPMSLWVRLGPQPTKRLSKGDDLIFLAQAGLASHKFRLQKERTTGKGVRIALFRHAARKRSGKLVLVREVHAVQAYVEIEFTYGIVKGTWSKIVFVFKLVAHPRPHVGGARSLRRWW